MADDKPGDLGYLTRVTKELERTLLEMEGQLDPILTTLELGDDPRVEWGTGLAQRARAASDCKQRAWTKIADLVERLAEMIERVDGANDTPKSSLKKGPGDSGGEKYVNVVIRGVLAKE